MTILKMHDRPCYLRPEDHKYIYLPTGEQMALSVTRVVNWFKPPYSGPKSAGLRGTHTHLYWQAKAEKKQRPKPLSPDGIDCQAWFDQIESMPFWNSVETIAAEYTMVDTKKSLGGQLDLLCRYKGKTILVDLKTKGASWTSASKEDKQEYKAQAGGYCYLLDLGNDAKGGFWVDECRTCIVTPNRVKWLPPYTPDECSIAWLDCWDKYETWLSANPF